MVCSEICAWNNERWLVKYFDHPFNVKHNTVKVNVGVGVILSHDGCHGYYIIIYKTKVTYVMPKVLIEYNLNHIWYVFLNRFLRYGLSNFLALLKWKWFSILTKHKLVNFCLKPVCEPHSVYITVDSLTSCPDYMLCLLLSAEYTFWSQKWANPLIFLKAFTRDHILPWKTMFHSWDFPRLLVCDTGLYLEHNDISFITVAICGGYISKYPRLNGKTSVIYVGKCFFSISKTYATHH